MTWKKRKLLSVLLAVLMLATAVPVFLVPAAAQTVSNITVTDNNDEVFFIGETIVVRWTQDVRPTSGPAVGIYAYNSSIGVYNLTSYSNASPALVQQYVDGGITYYIYEATFMLGSDLISLINETYPFHIYINASGSNLPSSLDLATRNYDLYVNYFDTPTNMDSLATGNYIGGTSGSVGSVLLIGDRILLNLTAKGTDSQIYGSGAQIYFNFDDYAPLLLTNDSNIYHGTLTLSKTTGPGAGFTVTNADGDRLYWSISPTATVVEPKLELLPLVENNTNQQFISLAYFVDNASTKYWVTTLPYNISVVLSDGLKWVGTNVTQYDYLTDNNRTLVVSNTNAVGNISTVLTGYNVSVAPGVSQGQINITLNFPDGTKETIYSYTFDILPQNEPAVIYVSPPAIVKGESFSISGAIADQGGTYNYTIVAINTDDPTYNVTILQGQASSGTYYEATWNTSTNWPNLPKGQYEIKLIVYNASNASDVYCNTSKLVTVSESLNLGYDQSPWGVYYPDDTVVFRGDFLRTDPTGKLNVTVMNLTSGGAWTPAVPFPITNINTTAKTFNFTLTFAAPGTYRVVVYETDVPNVNATVDITIPEHDVTLSEPSATINLGEERTIQVTTTANVSSLTITGAPLVPTIVVAEPFNTSTHLKVFNVTFVTNASVEPKVYEINITVPNGVVANYALTVNDAITVIDYPAKVVYGDTATIVAKAEADILDSDYTMRVLGWGYDSGSISGIAVGEPYNDTLGYRLINFTWDTSAYASSDWQNYPTHQIEVMDPWVKDTISIDIINSSQITLDPLGTIYIGSTVKITGTTYLTPGAGKITIKITDPQNASVVYATPSADVVNEKVGDKYKFVAEWGPINLAEGVYNVTAIDTVTGETVTLQVTVQGMLTVNTDMDVYYPDGKVRIYGVFDDATGGTLAFNITWFGGYDDTLTATVTNGTYEAYFDLGNLPAGYTGQVQIDVTYNNLVNATKVITITDTPSIQNLAVPAEPVKAGSLFNVSATTNLAVNGTVTIEIVNAANASDIKASEAVPVGDAGAFLYTVNTTNWTAGYYNITLSKGNVEVTKQVYVYVVGANISLVNGSLVVEPTEGIAPLDITVRANVTNTGDLDGSYTAILYVNGTPMKNMTVTVPFGETVLVEFNCTLSMPGVYNVTIGTLAPVQVTVNKKPYATISDYNDRVANASTVYFVVNNLGSVDAYATSQYVSRTIPIDVRTKTVLAGDFNMSVLTASDVVIAVGGPAVNPVTATYESIAPVHMVQNGTQWVIVTPNESFTWAPPTPWWNVTEGYFIIQLFEDNQTGALIVTIYGTDADSTAAGAYYFLTSIYPNIDSYTNVSYFVGLWQDTEPGADVPLMAADDTSGFSAGDTIFISAQG